MAENNPSIRSERSMDQEQFEAVMAVTAMQETFEPYLSRAQALLAGCLAIIEKHELHAEKGSAFSTLQLIELAELKMAMVEGETIKDAFGRLGYANATLSGARALYNQRGASTDRVEWASAISLVDQASENVERLLAMI